MMMTAMAAMAMSMAAPNATQAKQCSTHYTAIATMLIVSGAKEGASQAEKDAAAQKAVPWLQRAGDVLVTSGVKKAADDLPKDVVDNAITLLGDMADNKISTDQIVQTIGSCDQAYGLQTLAI